MPKTNTLRTVIAAAIAALNPRAHYAADTIVGRQRWSGSDLAGKAKRYSHNYAVQRAKAGAALTKAGGRVVAIDHGLLVTAVAIGQDDYGNLLLDTTKGVAVQASAARARLLRS
jgi:hypothetical protein